MEFFNLEISGELLSAIKPTSYNPNELLKGPKPQAPTSKEKKPDSTTAPTSIFSGLGLPR